MYNHSNKLLPVGKVLNICVLFSAIAVATGCGTTFKPEINKPTKLQKLEQPVSLATPVLSFDLPTNARIAKASRFEVGFEDNQIIVASTSGQLQSYTLAGQHLWSVDIEDEIVGGVHFDGVSQTAIVTTKSAKVIAIEAANGRIKWQSSLKGTVLAPALIHLDRIIVSANDGSILGLSLQTGETIWQFATQTPSISVRGSAAPTLLDNDTVLIGSADGRLHALNVSTGIPVWSRRVGVPSGSSEIQRMTDVDATPTIDNNQLFTISYSGQLIGLDLDSRQVQFVQDAASQNSLAVTQDAVITTTLDGMVKAFNRLTGELLWESDQLAYRKLSNPVVVGDVIAIGDLDGVVHFLSPLDGHIMSRVNTKGPINYLKQASGYLMTQTQSGQVNVWQVAR